LGVLLTTDYPEDECVYPLESGGLPLLPQGLVSDTKNLVALTELVQFLAIALLAQNIVSNIAVRLTLSVEVDKSNSGRQLLSNYSTTTSLLIFKFCQALPVQRQLLTRTG